MTALCGRIGSTMPQLPDEEIEEAEVAPEPGDHRHDTVVAEDGSLLDHLADSHGLEAPATLSPTTQDGLHDRLHHTEKARDDQPALAEGRHRRR